MATIGQQLTAPESGMQRIDGAAQGVTYAGSGVYRYTINSNKVRKIEVD